MYINLMAQSTILSSARMGPIIDRNYHYKTVTKISSYYQRQLLSYIEFQNYYSFHITANLNKNLLKITSLKRVI